MSQGTVSDIPDSELIRRALLNLRPGRNKPLWTLVSGRFALGSTYSYQLCVRFGLNPDATHYTQMVP